MKLAVVFEVPDDQADAYADVAARMIQHHAFAAEHFIQHWSFDQAMRPLAAVVVESSDRLTAALAMAGREIDQKHPWVPGATFQVAPELKPLFLALLNAVA